MVHLRVVAPREQAEQAFELLRENPTACHLVYFKGVAHAPDGDMILVDVPREEASVIVGDLKALGIPKTGSISVEPIDVQLSELAEEAERAAPGAPADAVIWEEVEARTSEESRLSVTYLTFMVLAALIAGVGDPPGLGDPHRRRHGRRPRVRPDRGVLRRGRRATRRGSRSAALLALVVGFPVAITSVWLAVVVVPGDGRRARDVQRGRPQPAQRRSPTPTSWPFFVAFCAGMAGMSSASATAKSGALIGVLISVTTIPAAANIAIAFAYEDWAVVARLDGAARAQRRRHPPRGHADARRPAVVLPLAAHRAPARAARCVDERAGA